MESPSFPLPEAFNQPLLWNSVRRVTLPRQPNPDLPRQHLPLPSVTGRFTLANGFSSSLLAAGVRSDEARPNWSLGAWLEVWLPQMVGSLTQFTDVRIGRYRVPLKRLQLIHLPPAPYPPNSISFELSFPHWLPSAHAELWQYIP